MQRLGFLTIRPRGQGHVWAKNNALELTRAVHLLHHQAFSLILICRHDNSGTGTEMQIPKLMARREGRNKQFLGIPMRRIASKTWAGGTIDQGLASDAQLIGSTVLPLSQPALLLVSQFDPRLMRDREFN